MESLRFSVIFQVEHFNPREQKCTHYSRKSYVNRKTKYSRSVLVRQIKGMERKLHYASSGLVNWGKYKSGQIKQ